MLTKRTLTYKTLVFNGQRALQWRSNLQDEHRNSDICFSATAQSRHSRSVYTRAAAQENHASRLISSVNNAYGTPSISREHQSCRRSYAVTSYDNYCLTAVKHCNKLRINTRYRQEEGSALLAGLIPVLELKKEVPSLDIKMLMWSGPPRAMPQELKADPVMLVTDEILKKVSGFPSVKGLLAVAELGLPQETDFTLIPPRELTRLLILDGVQDPGNLGTLMRTALALGWQGAYLLDGCCDPFNDKALRASRGAAFKLPFAAGSWASLQAILRHHNMTCYAAEAQDQSETKRSSGVGGGKKSPPTPKQMALILGAEGQGLSNEARATSLPVRIPMRGPMESLCVSQAGAILLFLLGIGSPYSLGQLGGAIETEETGLEGAEALRW